jgi:hypothetical protein
MRAAVNTAIKTDMAISPDHVNAGAKQPVPAGSTVWNTILLPANGLALSELDAVWAGRYLRGAAGAQRWRFLRKKIIASATAGMAISASQRISSGGIPP